MIPLSSVDRERYERVITTSRLWVRYLKEADYLAFSTLESDSSVKKFTGGASPTSRDNYQRFISVPSHSCMAVCAKDDGRFIGRCGFREADDRVELEIFLLPEEQGHGLGPELFDAMISHCFTAFPTSKVAATVTPGNSRAINLLMSRGFRDTRETVSMKSRLKHSLYVRFR